MIEIISSQTFILLPIIKMTEERFQGALDLYNELSGSELQLVRNDWNWSLIDDGGSVIADGDLEHIYGVLLLEARDLLN